MNKKEALKIYREYRERIAAYSLALNTIYYDKNTIAPKAGNPYRNRNLAYLSGELYSAETDPRAIEAIEYLAQTKLSETMTREIQLAQKQLEAVTKFSKEETMAYELLVADAGDAWLKAKEKNDYAIFAPYLEKLLITSKERAKRRDPDKNAYDVLLDDYESGMTMADYDHFFDLVKKELLPLIKQVNEHQEAVDDSFVHVYYPVTKQAKFCEKVLLKHIGFSGDWGQMGVTEHPFTSGFSKNDVRITTHYDDHDITSTIFSIIHEAGHAYYEHQVDSRYEDTLIKSGITSGMHESQSRFLENYIGRRASFWKPLYPKLQKTFRKQLKDVSSEQFIRAVSAARSSLIRTQADELTYPIHILIRYEIEKGIFNNTIAIKDLDKVWNQKYQEYLGVEVKDDASGILQDIHWSGASFGYFPTYALGSAIGAQLFDAMNKEIDIDGLLEKGKVKEIEKWLKNRVQFDGTLHSYNEILKRATGKEFDPQYYIDYLKEKYTELYNL